VAYYPKYLIIMLAAETGAVTKVNVATLYVDVFVIV
jgi:hypothetical protein